MSRINDDHMREMLETLKPYTVVTLRVTPRRSQPGADRIVWEHGQRNFDLRRNATLSIVCQVTDKSDIAGFCILSTNTEETCKIMDEAPGVKAGILTYETQPVRSFPGDAPAK